MLCKTFSPLLLRSTIVSKLRYSGTTYIPNTGSPLSAHDSTSSTLYPLYYKASSIGANIVSYYAVFSRRRSDGDRSINSMKRSAAASNSSSLIESHKTVAVASEQPATGLEPYSVA